MSVPMFSHLSRTQTADPLDLFNMWNCMPALSDGDEQSRLIDPAQAIAHL